MVTKLKDHELKWVKILSDVIKALLDMSISGEGWKKMKSENKIKCNQCEKFFSSERYMKSHATKIHKEVKPLGTGAKTCPICNKKFLTEWNLKSHLIVCSRQAEVSKKRKKPETPVSSLQIEPKLIPNIVNECDKKTQCPECNLNFSTEIEVNKHTKSEHPTQPRTCNECDMKFESMYALQWMSVQKKHEYEKCTMKKDPKHERKQFNCNVCDFKSLVEQTLLKHIDSEHEAKSGTPARKKKKKRKIY